MKLSSRFTILKRDNFTCFYCGRKPPEVELQVDHIKPRADGGSNLAENLVTSCRDCNLGKRDSSSIESALEYAVHKGWDKSLQLLKIWLRAPEHAWAAKHLDEQLTLMFATMLPSSFDVTCADWLRALNDLFTVDGAKRAQEAFAKRFNDGEPLQ